jgi:hypothetical protein
VAPDFVASTLEEAMDHIAASPAGIPLGLPVEESTAPPPQEAPSDAPAEAAIATSLARVPRAAADESAPEPSAPPTASAPSIPRLAPATQPGNARLESLAEQILQELRRSHEVQHSDFSVSKLLAGIVQVIAVSVMFLAYLDRDSGSLEPVLLLAIFLQTFTCSLLIMSRQK